MSDDQVDYMSDVFLQDVEPTQGLIKSRSAKREITMCKRKAVTDTENRKKNRPLSQVESSNREFGLNEPICESNKGFELLKKMGFEPGKGLGKSGGGIAEPVGLEMKNDRTGLGIKTEIAERISSVKECLEKSRLAEGDLDEFRQRIVEESHAKQLAADLATSQRTCHQLDMAHGLSQPDEEWYWPPSAITKNKDSDEEKEPVVDSSTDDQLTVLEKLKQVTEYLRDVYYYCIWCGTHYRGELDMANQCPGDTRDQH